VSKHRNVGFCGAQEQACYHSESVLQMLAAVVLVTHNWMNPVEGHQVEQLQQPLPNTKVAGCTFCVDKSQCACCHGNVYSHTECSQHACAIQPLCMHMHTELPLTCTSTVFMLLK
jgi:hypothetical protein